MKRVDAPMSKEDLEKYGREHEESMFRAEICAMSPESYTLEEKQRICEDIDLTGGMQDAAIKEDFESMPPEAQDAMFKMLCEAGNPPKEYWEQLLGRKYEG